METTACVIWMKDKNGRVYWSECESYKYAVKEVKAARADGWKLIDIWHAPIK